MNPMSHLEPVLAIGVPGAGELLLILMIVIVIFGHNRIPQLGDALGKGIKNFRKSFAKDETETGPVAEQVRELPTQQPVQPAAQQPAAQQPAAQQPAAQQAAAQPPRTDEQA